MSFFEDCEKSGFGAKFVCNFDQVLHRPDKPEK